jgi:tetratricopeptide (TPR) repeat protein
MRAFWMMGAALMGLGSTGWAWAETAPAKPRIVELGNLQQRAIADRLLMTGRQLARQGELRPALARVQRAIALYQQLRDDRAAAYGLGILAEMQGQALRLADGADTGRQLRAYGNTLGEPIAQMAAENHIALPVLMSGERGAFAEANGAAQTLGRAYQHNLTQAIALDQQGQMQAKGGNLPAAIARYNTGLPFRYPLRDRLGEAQTRLLRGEVLTAQTETGAALADYGIARVLALHLNRSDLRDGAAAGLIANYRETGNYWRAAELYQDRTGIALETEDLDTAARWQRELGDLYQHDLKDRERARLAYETALEFGRLARNELEIRESWLRLRRLAE